MASKSLTAVDVLGNVEYTGNYLGKKTRSHLADPIRHWFESHPEEIAAKNYFSATFRRQPNGEYRCFLEIVGKHHWMSAETGPTLPHALQKSLNNAIPDVSLSDWDNLSS